MKIKVKLSKIDSKFHISIALTSSWQSMQKNLDPAQLYSSLSSLTDYFSCFEPEMFSDSFEEKRRRKNISQNIPTWQFLLLTPSFFSSRPRRNLVLGCWSDTELLVLIRMIPETKHTQRLRHKTQLKHIQYKSADLGSFCLSEPGSEMSFVACWLQFQQWRS